MVNDYDNTSTENDNVLKYIYQLKQHLDNMSLFWQGLAKDSKGNLIRIAEPLAPDDFIFSQISTLQSVLNPHNFVSQLKSEGDEKINIILDTYTAFLQSIEREEYFNWDRFHSAAEGVYNTLHLFVNAMVGGFGAQFTIAAQSGITSKIPVNSAPTEKVPYVDVPNMFGFTDQKQNQQRPNNSHTDFQEEDNARDSY